MTTIARQTSTSRTALFALALLACAFAVGATFSVTVFSGDYGVNLPVSADNAGPAVMALLHGDIGAFAAHQPVMGLGSLLLRLPLAGLAQATGGGDLSIYRLGALACLLPCVLFVTWLGAIGRRSPIGLAGGVLAAGLVLAGPASANAIRAGHPEEILAGVLACAAVIVAIRGRAGWAGLLLGLAVGTKQWALVAALPLLVALPGRHLRACLIGAVTALALSVPAPLADPAAFARATHVLGSAHVITPFSAWWPLGSGAETGPSGPLARLLPFGIGKSEALLVALVLTLAASALRSWCLRCRGVAADPLALLALLGLVRCLADPGPVEYYYVALLVPLTVWETLTQRRLPLLSLASAIVVSLTFNRGLALHPTLVNAITLAWTAALGCHLGAHAFRIERLLTWPRLAWARLHAHLLRAATDN